MVLGTVHVAKSLALGAGEPKGWIPKLTRIRVDMKALTTVHTLVVIEHTRSAIEAAGTIFLHSMHVLHLQTTGGASCRRTHLSIAITTMASEVFLHNSFPLACFCHLSIPRISPMSCTSCLCLCFAVDATAPALHPPYLDLRAPARASHFQAPTYGHFRHRRGSCILLMKRRLSKCLPVEPLKVSGEQKSFQTLLRRDLRFLPLGFQRAEG